MAAERPKTSLAYHLAEAVFTLGYSQGAPVYKRMNQIAWINRLCRSMLASRTKPGEDLEKEQLQILSCIEYLRKNYEFNLDVEQVQTPKRITFETKLDEIQGDLLLLIGNNDLVDSKVLQDVYNAQWKKDHSSK